MEEPARTEWINRLPCIICQLNWPLSDLAEVIMQFSTPGSPRRSDSAHVGGGAGMAQKCADENMLPLCGGLGTADHHGMFDGRTKLPNGEVGAKAFAVYFGVDVKSLLKVVKAGYKNKEGECDSSL